MIYCVSPTLEQGIAPPQEDFPRPTWTKLIAKGLELSNSIEYARWDETPVQPMVCPGCWDASCWRSGLARLVTLADHLLWARPTWDDIDEFWRGVLREQHFLRESVLMPRRTWNRLRSRFPRLPPFASFPSATRRDLERMWIDEMPQPVRVAEPSGLDDRWRRTVLASDPLDLGPAWEILQSLCRWLRERPGEPLVGRIVRAKAIAAPLNTFYFDGPPFLEWPAFAVGWEGSFALGQKWVFVGNHPAM
jgi:hypothetical protein